MSPAEPQRKVPAAAPEGSRQVHGAEPARHVEPERPSHLRLVERRARRRARRQRLGLTVLVLGTAALCLGLVALHALIAENQFKLDRLQDQAAVVQARYEKLRLQVAQLEAPDRVVAVAEGRLGMRQPGSVTYLPAPGTSLPASRPISLAGQPGRATTTRSAGAGTVAAPQGDADWPTIKPDMGSSP